MNLLKITRIFPKNSFIQELNRKLSIRQNALRTTTTSRYKTPTEQKRTEILVTFDSSASIPTEI